MHRTLSVPRLFGCLSLLFALTLLVGLGAVPAQQPALGPNQSIIELAVGTSRTCQMSTRADLKRVENPNSNVVRVERVADKNNEVRLIAEHPGRTTITFTDQNNRVESHEIVVAASATAAAVAQPAGPAQEAYSLRLDKGSFKSIRLREIPTGGITNENSKVVKVLKSPDDLQVVTFEGVDFGRSRVVFYAGANKERMEVFDVIVSPEERVDRGVHQVQLEVVVAVVNRSMGRNMAFSWSYNGPNWFLSSLIGGPGGLTSALATSPAASVSALTGAGNANIPFGIINNNNSFMGFLRATRDEGLTKILSEPRLVTQSGRAANIISGGHVDIVSSGGIASAQISADFGTIVNFLPVVQPNGKIHLEVRTEVSTPTNTIPIPGAGNAGTVSFSVLKRSAQVSVAIEDGQTLAIGGLIQNRVDGTASKVPVLGDMPFFGAAFRSVAYSEIEEEMIILVTPRLVHPIDCTKIPHWLPGRETRSPDDFELFLEGILEAPRGQRNVIFHPHMYKPAYHSSANAGQYPCGNGNCYDRNGGCYNGNCAPRHAMQQTSGSSIATPGPTFPEVPGLTTSNSRIVVEPEMPGTLPTIREATPSLGPLVPTTPPVRQQEPIRILPPINQR